MRKSFNSRQQIAVSRDGLSVFTNVPPGHSFTLEGSPWASRDIAKGTCYFDWNGGRGTRTAC